MSSTYSKYKLALIDTGTEAGQWGTITNANLGSSSAGVYQGIEQAIGGKATIDLSVGGTIALSLTDSNAAQDARALFFDLGGSPAGAVTLQVPAIQKMYVVKNGSGQTVTVEISGGTGVAVPNGSTTVVYADGTNVVTAVNYIPSLTLGAALPVASGGTGATSLTSNNVVLGNGTSAVQFVAPGTSGNLLTSNGTTWTSAAPAPGGIEYEVKTANYTAADKEGILADTSGGAFTVTLPATPATGAQVIVADPTGDWGTNNLTIGRNGSTISGVAENLTCDISGASVQLVYDGTTWAVYAQVGGNGGTVVTLDGTQTLTNKTLGATTLSGTLSCADQILDRPVLEDYAIQGVAIGNTGATRTIDLESGNFFSATLDQACTFTFSNPAASGDFCGFALALTNGEAFTITWPVSVDWVGGTAPTLTASGLDLLVFVTYDGGTTWLGLVSGLDIK
jgi:hypothetical protein